MKTARLFNNGKSQAVRIPAEYRFEGDEVIIRKAPGGGLLLLPKVITYEHIKAVCLLDADRFVRDDGPEPDREFACF